MSYTYYKLQKSSAAVSIIKNFEKIRDNQLDLIQAEKGKYGAVGYAHQGGGIVGLQFPLDEHPEGWRTPRDLSNHGERCSKTGKSLCYYRFMGSSKKAKELREHWNSLKLYGFREFTKMFTDLPRGVSGWGFQQGLTIR